MVYTGDRGGIDWTVLDCKCNCVVLVFDVQSEV